MPTKAEITHLAEATNNYVSDQVYDLIGVHRRWVETGMISAEDVKARINALGTAIDLLLEPLITHMRERVYHMTSDTYALLSDTVSNILGLQDLLHNLAVTTNK